MSPSMTEHYEMKTTQEQNTETEKLHTRRQLASRFDVTPHTIRAWELKGLLRPVKVNQRVLRYPESQVKNLITHGLT